LGDTSSSAHSARVASKLAIIPFTLFIVGNYIYTASRGSKFPGGGGNNHVRRVLQEEPLTPEEQWYELAWGELPDATRVAYELLFTTYQIWCDESGTAESPIDDYDWFDLSTEQRAAAESLGYTEEIWCTVEGTWTCDDVISSTQYHSMKWDELPSDIQELYETLGETKESWEGEVPSSIENYDWFDMSEEQREAAESLGYTEEFWCTEDKSWICDEVILSTQYHSMKWDELPSDIQKLYETLGETEESWEGEVISPTEGKDWFDMAEEQRVAAESLGFTEEIWCSEPDGTWNCDSPYIELDEGRCLDEMNKEYDFLVFFGNLVGELPPDVPELPTSPYNITSAEDCQSLCAGLPTTVGFEFEDQTGIISACRCLFENDLLDCNDFPALPGRSCNNTFEGGGPIFNSEVDNDLPSGAKLTCFLTENYGTAEAESPTAAQTPSPTITPKDEAPSPIITQQDGTPSPIITQQDGTPSPIITQQDVTPSPTITQDGTPSPTTTQQDGTPPPIITQQDGTPSPSGSTVGDETPSSSVGEISSAPTSNPTGGGVESEPAEPVPPSKNPEGGVESAEPVPPSKNPEGGVESAEPVPPSSSAKVALNVLILVIGFLSGLV